MSHITIRKCVIGLLFFGLAALVGCGASESNPQAPFDADAQAHAAGWLPANHATAATVDIASCQACHGEDLLGGISGYGCTSCHIGGPTSAHPADWVDLTYHGPYVSVNGASSCRNVYCQGANLEGVNLSGPACQTCH
mgnify:CR=1 FL=1